MGHVARTQAAAWEQAWNAHDMEAAASLVETDVDFVTVAGVWLRGRDEFLLHHRELHRLQMRNSCWRTHGSSVRGLGDGLALAHVEWSIQGDRDPDGTPRTGRRGHFSWVLQRQGEGWLIVAAQNTNLLGHVAHRLSSPAESRT
jgi:uncharacterized protein (TIGR02246 family)